MNELSLRATKKEIAGFYRNKKILIIGGTGSVGERMMKELLSYEPSVIRILSRDEYKQFMLKQKYSGHEKRLRFLLGDVRDPERVLKAANAIDIIFNLAALKHVPACEYDPFEAVKTNVIGTQNVIDAAIACNCKNVLFTSSDKAISPTNAMGATKLLAERLMISADYSKGTAKTVFSSVRFGNVMGSRGSVIPLFLDQIRDSGEITITDATMTRFMMSLQDAVSLTIRAAAISRGGEIFVLKMPNVRIKDLYEVVIDMACEKYRLNPKEIRIKEIGLRQGEKHYEELMTEHESRFAFDLSEMYAILPSEYKHEQLYLGAERANIQKYSSDTVVPVTKRELKKLLAASELIN